MSAHYKYYLSPTLVYNNPDEGLQIFSRVVRAVEALRNEGALCNADVCGWHEGDVPTQAMTVVIGDDAVHDAIGANVVGAILVGETFEDAVRYAEQNVGSLFASRLQNALPTLPAG